MNLWAHPGGASGGQETKLTVIFKGDLIFTLKFTVLHVIFK